MVKIARKRPELSDEVKFTLIAPDGSETPIGIDELLATEITMRAPRPPSLASSSKVADLEKRLQH